MWSKLRITHTAKILATLIVALVIIGFANRKQTDDTCKEIVIRIENQYDNFFIDKSDVMQLLTAEGSEVIIGTSFDELNLKKIEQRLAAESFIKDGQIYKDLKGNMLVEVSLRRPMARIVSATGSYYVAMDGTILPVSDKYSTRVVVLSGKYFNELNVQNLNDSEEGKELFRLLQFIDKDKFWKAQVAQIDVSTDMDLLIYPQVTKQLVEFGSADDFKEKFKKLKIFYKRILPQKGWNTYERVNLKYKDQIIAE